MTLRSREPSTDSACSSDSSPPSCCGSDASSSSDNPTDSEALIAKLKAELAVVKKENHRLQCIQVAMDAVKARARSSMTRCEELETLLCNPYQDIQSMVLPHKTIVAAIATIKDRIAHRKQQLSDAIVVKDAPRKAALHSAIAAELKLARAYLDLDHNAFFNFGLVCFRGECGFQTNYKNALSYFQLAKNLAAENGRYLGERMEVIPGFQRKADNFIRACESKITPPPKTTPHVPVNREKTTRLTT